MQNYSEDTVRQGVDSIERSNSILSKRMLVNEAKVFRQRPKQYKFIEYGTSFLTNKILSNWHTGLASDVCWL